MTDRFISIFMFWNLFKQADAWSSGLIGMTNKRMKQKFQIAMNANRNLLDEMEKELALDDPENIEKFWEDSEYFSKALEMIRKAETPDKKQEMILLMREYLNGNVIVNQNE